jgi:transposase InsO family protein
MWVQDTWRMALGRRQPAAGLLHHADRGSQDASHTSQDMLATHGIVCRMRRQGACLDNAVAERCFGRLNREWTAHRSDATRQEARDEMIASIEMFYHSRRKHSYLGYVSPNAYEQCARVA